MFISLFLNNISSFSPEQNIPRILIAQRTISSPMIPQGPDSLFFEKIFRERTLPIMIKNNIEEKSYHDSNEEEIKHIYKNRHNISDRVNGNLEEINSPDHQVIPRRITFGILERSRNNVNVEKKKSKKLYKKSPWLRFLLFTLAIGISAAVGYQCGKIYESSNYVRIPTTN